MLFHSRSTKATRIYSKLSGSMSTSTAVSGISFSSQYASAPPSNFVSTERFGDFSKNWNRCSFFRRASGAVAGPRMRTRSEEHTSELQSRLHLVCRLLLEKKKNLRLFFPTDK